MEFLDELPGGAREIVPEWGRAVSIAYLVELITGSVFGLHGIGWLVKGRWKTGLIQLAASILVNILFVAFWAPTAGFAVIPQLSLQVGWALYSARILNDDLRKQQRQVAPPQTMYPTYMPYAPPQLPAAQPPYPTQYPTQYPAQQPQQTRTAPTWRPPQQTQQPGQRAVPSRPAPQSAPPIWPATQPAQPTQRKPQVGPMDPTLPSSKHWPS